MNGLTPCRWSFDDTEPHDGFTDGTTWNGWDNIWVTPAVHAAVIEEMAGHGDADMVAMEPVDGLICYAYGYCTQIEDDTPDPMDADM